MVHILWTWLHDRLEMDNRSLSKMVRCPSTLLGVDTSIYEVRNRKSRKRVCNETIHRHMGHEIRRTIYLINTAMVHMVRLRLPLRRPLGYIFLRRVFDNNSDVVS